MPQRQSARLRLPREVRRALRLAPGERALAWARDDQGHWYVGSQQALHLGPTGDDYRTLAWEAIERVDWHSDTRRLAVVEVAEWGEPEHRTLVTVAEPGALLELLRERVTKSVVVSVYAPVRRRLGLTVVGRRSPTGEGAVTWSFVLAQGLRPDDADVQQVADETLARAQAEVAGL